MFETGSQFGSFEPSVLMRMPEVEQVVGYKKSQIYSWIKRETFPRPVKTDHGSRWVASEVRDWIERKKAERDGDDHDVVRGSGSESPSSKGGTAPASDPVKRQDPFRCSNCQFARKEMIASFKELGLLGQNKPDRVEELERENAKLKRLIAQLIGQH